MTLKDEILKAFDDIPQMTSFEALEELIPKKMAKDFLSSSMDRVGAESLRSQTPALQQLNKAIYEISKIELKRFNEAVEKGGVYDASLKSWITVMQKVLVDLIPQSASKASQLADKALEENHSHKKGKLRKVCV